MTNTPEETELRKAISDLPVVDPQDTTLGEYIGRDNLDAVMNLITLHTQKASRYVALNEAHTADRNLRMYPDYNKMKMASVDRLAYLYSGKPLIISDYHLTNPTEGGEK